MSCESFKSATLLRRNAVALLSMASMLRIDPPSLDWLGYRCRHSAVRGSGLWNVEHVFKDYDRGFLTK